MEIKKEVNIVLSYLKLLNIYIEGDEFLYQIESHPDAPSLLAYSDALSFFGIDNLAFNLDFNEIDNLPDNFLSIVKNPSNEIHLYVSHIKQSDNLFFVTDHEGKTLQKDRNELKEIWSGVVLLAEKSEDSVSQNIYLTKVLPVFLVGLIFLAIYVNQNLFSLLFSVLVLIGVYLSIEAIKTELGFDSTISKQFCTAMENADCGQVINSKKSIFGKIKLSDISIWFFSSQLLGLLIFESKSINSLFSLLFVILCCALPVTLYSVYFQKYVERKWCPICLTIIALMYAQFFYLLFNFNNYFNIEKIRIYDLSILLVSFSVPAILYFFAKKILVKFKNLKETSAMAMKYVKNYQYFKRVLKGNRKINFENNVITIGNRNARNVLTVVTTPLCGFCKEMHEILHTIYENYKNDIKIEIRFNISGTNDEKIEQLYIQLYNNYLTKGEEAFIKALEDWFDNKNIEDWLRKYSLKINNKVELLDSILTVYHENNKLGLNFTPTLYVNGYEYPNLNRKNIVFFIPDLIEDDQF